MADATTSQTGFWLTDALATLANGSAQYLTNRLAFESQMDELQLYRQQQLAWAIYQREQQPATITQAAQQNPYGALIIGAIALAVVYLIAKA